jgi:hypothetical protein
MAHKKTRIARRIYADLDDIFTLLEKSAYRVLALLGAIDLLVRVWRVM